MVSLTSFSTLQSSVPASIFIAPSFVNPMSGGRAPPCVFTVLESGQVFASLEVVGAEN